MLQELASAQDEHVSQVRAAGANLVVGSSDGDLRRLKRHFSSLKNTFLHYHVKEAFIDGITPFRALLNFSTNQTVTTCDR